MSAEQNIETARQMYEALGSGDLQAILDRVTDDVDWCTDAAPRPRRGTAPARSSEDTAQVAAALTP